MEIEIDKSLQEQADKALTVPDGVVINNIAGYQQASDTLKEVKRLIKELTEARMKMTRPIDEAKKNITTFFQKPLDHLKRSSETISRCMVEYNQRLEQERQVEEDRLRVAAENETRRLRLLAEKRAQTQEKKGNTEEAEAIRESVPEVIAPVLASKIPKVAGSYLKETWSGEVFDMALLIKAVADGAAPLALLTVDQVKLNKMAIALKDELNYPGVRAVRKQGIASR